MPAPRKPAEPTAANGPVWNCAGCQLCKLTPGHELCRLRHLLCWLETHPTAAPPPPPPDPTQATKPPGL